MAKPFSVGDVYVGDRITSTVTFSDPDNGEPVDPTVVTARYRRYGDAAVHAVYGTDSEVERLSPGVYRFSFTITDSGRWFVGWLATGSVEGAIEGVFQVPASAFA